MTGSPLLAAWRARTRNRLRADGPVPTLLSWLGTIAALALAAPIVDEMFMGWLAGPPAAHHDAILALLLRSGIVITGWVALDTYTALIRDGDREILALWPIDPARTVRFELLRLAVSHLWLVVAVGVLFLPLLALGPLLWALAVVHTLVTGVLALSLSAAVVLLAVDASDSPTWRPLLDLVRGQNHPAQAAFIYAPALVLVIGGATSFAAATGVTRTLEGQPLGVLLLALPLVLAAAVATRVPGLARRNWFRAGHVMAEVDARYALIEDQEERLGVYLDWTARFLPPRVAVYALRDLRHGWRQRRTWVTGAWLVGLAALVASWSSDPVATGRTALVVAAGSWWLAAVALRLAHDEPEFLQAWLPPDVREQAVARVYVVGLWLAPVVGLGALGTLFWKGVAGFAVVVGVGLVSSGVAALAAVLLARRGGLVVYGPLAAVAVLSTAQGVLS
ncbi:MAG: hypothetical protein H6736_13270 [Alphaproteobacteria bacterium]|nr:hypothetical protein [Alphaproteobacteria bacterium]MCB9692774.1 hypothetical protein [Alphaproteobacteria bacterium]